MNATLGIDIGTYESKGVLVDADGRVLASAARPHELIVPRAGWAEHRAEEDWWGDFVWLCRKLLADSGLDASEVKAVGASAIGPCMLPVDAEGAPLMNAVLYGVDTRAAREIEDLTASIGADRILSHSGNALTSQAVGPKILWLKRNRPDIYAKARMFLNATSFLVHRLTGRFVTDHYSASNVAPLYDIESRTWSDALTQDITELDRLPEIAWTTEIAGRRHAAGRRRNRACVGTPVIVGTIDAAAEAISVGVLDRGRDDADVRLDHLHDPGRGRAHSGSTALARAVAVRRPIRLAWPGLRPAGRSPIGSPISWRGTSVRRRRWPRSRRRLNVAARRQRARFSPLFFRRADADSRSERQRRDRRSDFGAHARRHLPGRARGHRLRDQTHLRHLRRSWGAALDNRRRGRRIAQPDLDASHVRCLGAQHRRRERSASALPMATPFSARLALGDVSKSAIKQWNPAAFRIEPDPRNARLYKRRYATFRELYPRIRDLMGNSARARNRRE